MVKGRRVSLSSVHLLSGASCFLLHVLGNCPEGTPSGLWCLWVTSVPRGSLPLLTPDCGLLARSAEVLGWSFCNFSASFAGGGELRRTWQTEALVLPGWLRSVTKERPCTAGGHLCSRRRC